MLEYILHYVVKEGRYFFLESFANKLQRDAFEAHFQRIEQVFDGEKLLRELNL